MVESAPYALLCEVEEQAVNGDRVVYIARILEVKSIQRGSAARHSSSTDGSQPADALVMGILDSMDVGGTVTFRKS